MRRSFLPLSLLALVLAPACLDLQLQKLEAGVCGNGVVDQTIECMKELIVRNRRLEIRNFGVFRVKTRKARVGRNPKNKKTYPINEHQAVTFKGGKGVKEIESGGVAGN